jgi:hypothetical protein
MFGDPSLEYRANIRDTHIRVKSMVSDIPWRIGHGSEKFRLIALNDRSVGLGGAAPQFNSVYKYNLMKHLFSGKGSVLRLNKVVRTWSDGPKGKTSYNICSKNLRVPK